VVLLLIDLREQTDELRRHGGRNHHRAALHHFYRLNRRAGARTRRRGSAVFNGAFRSPSVRFRIVADLKIRAMTQEEFSGYRRRAISEYAAEHVRAGNWKPETAEQRAAQETDELLPDGVDTAGMVLLVGETD
jgi:hypothetical protein